MVGRAFSVKIDLDLHAISCPGVWLCPSGKVSLQINIFDSCTSTHKLTPIFPLLYHNKFIFKKIITGITTLVELEKKLSKEYIFAELSQWSPTENRNVCLATFKTTLVNLLYPVPCFKGVLAGVDIDLLMEPSKLFPGILSPKIEVSTKTTIEEVTDFNDSIIEAYIINPKTINSMNQCCIHKKKVLSPTKEILRQKKVCHTGQTRVNSYMCRICRQQNSVKDVDNYNTSNQYSMHSTNKCYLSAVQKQEAYNCSTNTPNKFCENYTICNDAHIFDNCPICLKYNCYFSKKKPNSDRFSKLYNTSNYQRPPYKYPQNKKKFSNEFNCNTIHENCINKVSKLSNIMHSVNLENTMKNKNNFKVSNDDINHKCSTLERYKSNSICRSNSVPSLKDDLTASILLAKMKQLETTKEKLNYANCQYRNLDYTLSNNKCQNNEVQKRFYKNLEKFYKRMYKQAKKRSHNLHET